MPGQVHPAGYYWARHPDGDVFIVLREGLFWFAAGVGHAIEFDPACLLHPVAPARPG